MAASERLDKSDLHTTSANNTWKTTDRWSRWCYRHSTTTSFSRYHHSVSEVCSTMDTSRWVCVYKVACLSWPDKLELTSLVYPRGCPEAATRITLHKSWADFEELHLRLRHLFSSRVRDRRYPDLSPTTEGCEQFLDFISRFSQVKQMSTTY